MKLDDNWFSSAIEKSKNDKGYSLSAEEGKELEKLFTTKLLIGVGFGERWVKTLIKEYKDFKSTEILNCFTDSLSSVMGKSNFSPFKVFLIGSEKRWKSVEDFLQFLNLSEDFVKKYDGYFDGKAELLFSLSAGYENKPTGNSSSLAYSLEYFLWLTNTSSKRYDKNGKFIFSSKKIYDNYLKEISKLKVQLVSIKGIVPINENITFKEFIKEDQLNEYSVDKKKVTIERTKLEGQKADRDGGEVVEFELWAEMNGDRSVYMKTKNGQSMMIKTGPSAEISKFYKELTANQ